MGNLEDLGAVIRTEILIVGGGFGGLVTAIKAKELASKTDILMVEKQTIGWSGKASKIGGGVWVKMPEDDADKFVKYHVSKIGIYLNDQELLYSFANGSYEAVKQLLKWGANIPIDKNGEIITTKHPAGFWSGTGLDLDVLRKLSARAHKLGVKKLNKVQVVDLLKQDDRVVGAVGFNILDSSFYIFKAKVVILANGSQNFRMKRMWASGTGDGIGAAYRAGAEMRNAEFGNFFDVDRKDTDTPCSSGSSAYLFNARGENISKRYIGELEPDTPISIILGMEKEVKEGRGPIYMDAAMAAHDRGMSKNPKFFAGRWGQPKIIELANLRNAKQLQYGSPPSEKVEVAAALNAELSPLRVDHNMKTSLEGLFAIGDICYQGSSWAGAVPAPPGRLRGSGIGNALFTSLKGAAAASRYSADTGSPPEVDYKKVRELKAQIFSPLDRDEGLSAADAIYEVQNLVGKVKYNLRRNKDRLNEAISIVEERRQAEADMYAKDTHDLGKCHEAKNMLVCAEMGFRAALMRTESRGFHFREDYPERDDENWLKWIIIKQVDGKMVLSTEPVPIDKYKVKP